MPDYMMITDTLTKSLNHLNLATRDTLHET